MTRQDKALAFIQSAQWQTADVKPLAGDASNRKYERLHHPDGRMAVLMDAPPEKGEDVRPFISVARYLTSVGLSAPEIFHKDVENGFLLIEDLGDRLFAREMANDPSKQNLLYESAVDVLVHLHRQPAPDLPIYDADITAPLAALAFDWYQAGATGSLDDAAKSSFLADFDDIVHPYDNQLTVLIQRDYHAENLLWLPERTGVAQVGLLDFQDAMLGHPAYDLVSILQDARRDVPPDIEALMKTRFIVQNGLTATEFDAAYAVFGLQRNLRILGVFARLCLRDNKAHYPDLIPRVWGHVLTNLRHPALAKVSKLLATSLPAPTPDVISTLKSKSGLWHSR